MISIDDATNLQCETKTQADEEVVVMGDFETNFHNKDNQQRLSVASNSSSSVEDIDDKLSILNVKCETMSDDFVVKKLDHETINAKEKAEDSSEVASMDFQPRLITDDNSSQYSCCVSRDNENSQNPENNDICPCDMRNLCKFNRAIMDDELKREIKWHVLWTELRDHVRSIFENALRSTSLPSIDSVTERYECDSCRLSQLRENVILICQKNSQQLLLMLVAQAQEFVVGLKNQIKNTLTDEKLTNVAEMFLTRILDGYDAFVSTAKQLTDLLKPLEDRHLLKFNLTWEFFNKALYQNGIWLSEPSMRNVTGSFTSQLTKSHNRHSYQALFERYFAFVEEMMKVAELWPESERLIVKWNETRIAERKKSESSNEKKILDENLEFENDTKVVRRSSNSSGADCEDLSNDLNSLTNHSPNLETVNDDKTSPKDCESAETGSIEKTRIEDCSTNPRQEITLTRQKTDTQPDSSDDLSNINDYEPHRRMCRCIYEHLREIDETGSTIEFTDFSCLCVLNLRWFCGVGKECPCLAITGLSNRSSPPTSSIITTDETIISSDKIAGEDLDIESTFSESIDSSNIKLRHSTTQTYSHSEDIDTFKNSSTPPSSPSPPPPPPLPPPSSDISTETAKPDSEKLNHNHRDVSTEQAACKRGHTTHSRTPSKEPSGKGVAAASNHHNHHHHHHHHRAHAHSNHACHKQSKVEQIERVSCNDSNPGDGGDCSDSVCSQDDSCSTSSSTQRDSSRHCDCCYCEVFGPGIPSVAPVSRNYNEMRERLRHLLTKKKATKCKVSSCSPPKNIVKPNETAKKSGDSNNTNRTTRQANAPPPTNNPRAVVTTAPVTIAVPRELPNQSEHRDQRNLEALLDFIEGNQGTKRDHKKTEKKARQKQRKLEEMLKKAKEEEHRQKLIELQKKTPNVTITVVDPQKPTLQNRLLSRNNLPEISILPAMPPRVSVIDVTKMSIKKKDKKNHQQQQQQTENISVKVSVSKSKSIVSSKSAKSDVSKSLVKDIANSKQNSCAKVGKKTDKVSKNAKNSVNITTEIVEEPQITEVKLTKKQRKTLRREIKKMEEAKANEPQQQQPQKQQQRTIQTTDINQPQIVTIKRVMESNNAEPTVTITLKGQTPAEDKVLFTLVNGQTKEPGTSDQNQSQSSSGKKKKGKGKNSNNNQGINQTQQQSGKGSQQNVNNKSRPSQKTNDTKITKNQQQQQQIQPNVEKSKSKKPEDKKIQQQPNVDSTKSTKSKKNSKNPIPTEIQQTNVTVKTKNAQQKSQPQQQQLQQQQNLSKKQNKIPQQTPQKSNKNQKVIEMNAKNSKIPQQQENRKTQNVKKTKNVDTACANKQSIKIERIDNNRLTQIASKQSKLIDDSSNGNKEFSRIPLSSQLKDISTNTRLNIENLKLPPGITITKVDAPTKSMPIKSAQLTQKPSVAASKQTTIIAAPMSGAQSNYPGPQTGGNVIVVDTGKLKQDLLPKNNDKEILKESQLDRNDTTGKKKKKKKKKKGSNVEDSGVNMGAMTNSLNRGGNDSGKENIDEPARILHNAGSNMVTIRNPAFSPAPKIDPTPQAAIIKVSENGMVTIRSPALQQAINAGLTPPSKPDFIVKGDTSEKSVNSTTLAIGNRPTLTQTNSSLMKNSNVTLPSNLAELRDRLTSNCTSLPGLANIQISRVTNGQAIPENGINLKGTSVTLTKVRSITSSENIDTKKLNNVSLEDIRQAKSAVREAIDASATLNTGTTTKNKKKKKRGNGSRQGGDDWNLVESVFTPKDIDLEDGEMDDAERELEAFKRFCLQSVPPPRKEKVNLNIKDIVLKKKSSSSSSSSSSGAAIAAN